MSLFKLQMKVHLLFLITPEATVGCCVKTIIDFQTYNLEIICFSKKQQTNASRRRLVFVRCEASIQNQSEVLLILSFVNKT